MSKRKLNENIWKIKIERDGILKILRKVLCVGISVALLLTDVPVTAAEKSIENDMELQEDTIDTGLDIKTEDTMENEGNVMQDQAEEDAELNHEDSTNEEIDENTEKIVENDLEEEKVDELYQDLNENEEIEKDEINLNSEESYIWDGTIATGYSEGDGSKEKPYIISNGSELAYLASEIQNKRGNNAYYELSDDIYLNDVSNEEWIKGECNSWTPIGMHQNPGSTEYNIHMEKEFTGHFDGKGHTIYGVFIVGNENGVGLFGSVEHAEILNLNLSKSYISGGDYVGGIVGSSHFFNTIKNSRIFLSAAR